MPSLKKPYHLLTKRALLLLFAIIPIFSFGQKVGIPYRVGNQWGLADTLGKVILPPKYDSIEQPNIYESSRFSIFYTHQDGLKGVIYENKEIIKPIYSQVGISNDRFIYGRIKFHQEIIYNFKGQKLFQDTIRRIGEAFWRSRQTSPWMFKLYEYGTIHMQSGLIYYNEKTQQIQQHIISGCDQFSISQITLGNQKMEANNDLRQRRNIFGDEPRYEIIYDSLNWLVEVVKEGIQSSHKLSYSPQNDVFKLAPISLSEKKQIQKNQYGSADGRAGMAGDPGMDGRERNSKDIDSVKFTLRLGTLRQHIHVSAKQNYRRSTPSWDTTFKVKPPLNTEIRIVNYSKLDGNWTHFKNDLSDVQLSVTNYVIYKQNDLWGIITDNAVVPAEYESVRGIRDRFGKLFIVSKYDAEHHLKYGIIDEKGRQLLPISCDSLIFNSDNFLSFFEKYIMIKEEKYYMMGSNFVPLIDQVYDSIIQPANSNFKFNGYLDGKLQYFTVLNYKPGKISPWLPFHYSVFDRAYFDGYQVWKLCDKSGKFVGYGDTKGFYYFRD